MVKYLSFHNPSFAFKLFFHVNDKAIVRYTPCLSLGWVKVAFGEPTPTLVPWQKQDLFLELELNPDPVLEPEKKLKLFFGRIKV
jgi:hypothetical protein